ncbi:hypothetical protein LAV_00209 [Sphingobium phage Lacusarx]|uniref:DUF5983 domain-containing protein n=1 Tax=Sphingobium phage Lacusarx TaxID=1980139 RepID=A0A1W6DXE4_9CAUD|nr:hypothetical protein FDH44_gp094 [Sphingobium phage Lacusarx]ARK07584.1 hypothetical protein LAV_00209 [Sphingobium phage Lacusarx]
MEVAKMLVLSTAHVAETTAQKLDAGQAGVISYRKGDYGWFVYCGDLPDSVDVASELERVIRFAHNHDFQWIMFDRDGDTIADLPSFDW